MKKLFLAVLPLMVLGMTACGGEDPSGTSTSGASTSQKTSQKTSGQGPTSTSVPGTSTSSPSTTTYSVNFGTGVDDWSKDNAVIFTHPWGASGDLGDAIVSGTSFTLPEGTTGFMLVRMPDGSTAVNMDTAWNKSIDLAPGTGTLTFSGNWTGGVDGKSVFEWVTA